MFSDILKMLLIGCCKDFLSVFSSYLKHSDGSFRSGGSYGSIALGGAAGPGGSTVFVSLVGLVVVSQLPI